MTFNSVCVTCCGASGVWDVLSTHLPPSAVPCSHQAAAVIENSGRTEL